ncbi:hypothetical protein SBI67_12375 [Mycolicibacterium sp. 120266]|uniref:hypothetical protein n=1 Tax=Mycolicibacterium sp. 120266 TaxID=3090601 RepID=UPI00299D8D03|nr:hypothetical protein [Mycolicibacterium sp. 120266]MDX1872922.1 hypothetical protein [Mycolicibacterium sp. 120266]
MVMNQTAKETCSVRNVLVCTGMIVAGLGLGLSVSGTASAAPSSEISAQDTIRQLESEGYRVIVSRVGSGSIDDCSVSAVRQGRSVTGPQPLSPTGSWTLVGPGQVLQYTTMHVDLVCKR